MLACSCLLTYIVVIVVVIFYCYYFITLKRFFVSSLACGPQYKPAKSYKWPYKSRKQIQTHENSKKKKNKKTKQTKQNTQEI